MKDTVLIFARVPRLGMVKKRLAAEIGARQALRFHLSTLAGLLRSLTRDRTFRTILVLTPDCAVFCSPIRVPTLRQGPGDLGQRMDRAFRRFPRGRVALVGSDIPDLRASHLRQAFASLGPAPAVFGPAADGGYWLVAMGPRRPSSPFRDVRWSTHHALADTLGNFPGHRVRRLQVLQDMDTAADFTSSPRKRPGNRPISVAHSRSGEQ